jgi:putative transposase
MWRMSRWRVATTHNAPDGFQIHPQRWVVERTFAWLVRYRLGKDYEFQTDTSEALILAAMTHLMVRRLHPLK